MSKRVVKSLDAIIIEDPTDLTPQMQVFINAYIVCLNATEAARVAKYGGDDASLAAHASRLLRNGKVAREIDKRLAQHAMSANETLARVTQIGRGDLGDIINESGGIDLLEAKRRAKSHLIKRFKRKTKTITTSSGEGNGELDSEILEEEIEIEMYSALEALSMLSKYHGLTNTIKIEDWRTEVVRLIRDDKVSRDELLEEFEPDVVTQLLIEAGMGSNASGEGQ
jgi:phage terminase small subunit